MRTNADCSSTTTCVTLDADYYSPLKRNVLKRYVYLKEVLQADVMTSIPVSPPRRVRTPILICPSAKEEENGCFGRSPMNALQPPIPIAMDDPDVIVSCGSGNGSCEVDHGNAASLSGLGCLEKSESAVCQEVKSLPDALQRECVDGVNHDVSVHGDTPEGGKGVEDAVAEHDKTVAVIASEQPDDAAKTERSKPVTMSVPEKPVDVTTTEQSDPIAVTAEPSNPNVVVTTERSNPVDAVSPVQCKPVTATMPDKPVEIATTEQSDSIAVTAEQNKPVAMSVPEKPVEIATTEQNKPVTMSVPEKPVEIAKTEQNKPTATLSTKQSHPQPSPNHSPQNPSPPTTAATIPPNNPSFFSLLFKWFHFFSPVS